MLWMLLIVQVICHIKKFISKDHLLCVKGPHDDIKPALNNHKTLKIFKFDLIDKSLIMELLQVK
jgi:hypothetical protein